jgi:peptidyl-prolyl cis-trans isomerase SurA
MRHRWLQIALLLTLAVECSRAGNVIDRIVAVVNGHPLLQSDWNDAANFEALQRGQAPNTTAAPGRRATFDRMVEQELVRQQMQAIYTPEPEVIRQRERELRGLYPEASTDAGWEKLLASYGFDRAQLEDAISAQLQTVRFVDIRLRPTVKVDSAEIEAYYRDKLAPEVRKTGAEPDPLSSVSGRINDLLVEEKINKVFFDWIANLRTQSKIEVFLDEENQAPEAEPAAKSAETRSVPK